MTMCVNKGIPGLYHGKVLRGVHSKADVALKVPWLLIAAFNTGTVLREFSGSTHDKFHFFIGTRYALWINYLVEVGVRG